MEHLAFCREHGYAIMIGTTGLDDRQRNEVRDAGRNIPMVFAANTSVGINLCVALLETAGRVLGDHTDVEVIEAHHRHKMGAPSGTALLLGETVARTLGRNLQADGVFAREGHSSPRPAGSIGFSTIRGGDIAGEHTVMFIGDSERIEITHRATDRRIFAGERYAPQGGSQTARRASTTWVTCWSFVEICIQREIHQSLDSRFASHRLLRPS